MSGVKSTKTIQQFIDELVAIKQEHGGDIPVFLNNGKAGVLAPRAVPVIMKESYSEGGWYIMMPKDLKKGCLIYMMD